MHFNYVISKPGILKSNYESKHEYMTTPPETLFNVSIGFKTSRKNNIIMLFKKVPRLRRSVWYDSYIVE